MSAICASGWGRKLQEATSPTTRRTTSSALVKNRHSRWRTRTVPHICQERLSWLWARLRRFHESPTRFAPERMGWHEHVDGVFHGCEKFFRPGYAANLVSSWIPALSGVKDKLEAGA